MNSHFKQHLLSDPTVKCTLYENQKANAPLIVFLDGFSQGQALLDLCIRRGLPSFSLLDIPVARWDQQLSPWPSGPVTGQDDHFTGEADSFLKQIENDILPEALSMMDSKPSWTGICGYSMAGLFAVYALYQSSSFSRAVCASGSLWYPGFEKWALSTSPEHRPQAIYLSLGNTETRTSNPYLRRTGEIMQNLNRYWKKLGIESTFVWNSGNHFQDPSGRTVQGIKWILSIG